MPQLRHLKACLTARRVYAFLQQTRRGFLYGPAVHAPLAACMLLRKSAVPAKRSWVVGSIPTPVHTG